ncbi:TnsD family Tn7-like transposition protein [Marivirga atlantica]
MKTSSGDIHTRLGLNAGKIKAITGPRYCVKCLREDYDLKREPFLRRFHQITAIDICIKHNIYLTSNDKFDYRYNKHKFIEPDSLSINGTIVSNSNKRLLAISRKVVSLCEGESKLLRSFTNDPYFYNKAIKEVGYIKGKKCVDLEKLYVDFTTFYGANTLKALQSEVSRHSNSCWLKQVVRKVRKSIHPIRHVLLLEFIHHKRTIQSHYASELRKPCRNPVCPDHGTSNTTKINYGIDAKTAREIAYIKCECGFIYTESYNKEKAKINRRVKEFGQLWIDELIILMNKKLPIRAIARKLNCDSKTILCQAKNIHNNTLEQNDTLRLKKEKWSKLKGDNPTMSISQLRSLNPALFIYLYKVNKEWIINQKYPISKRNNRKPIDWKKRDQEWLFNIIKGLRKLNKKGFKNRISDNVLIRLSGHESTFLKNKARLPACMSFIKKKAESPLEYRKRRLLQVSDSYSRGYYVPPKWRLYREAGIRKEYISKDIEILAEEILQRLTYQKVAISG